MRATLLLVAPEGLRGTWGFPATSCALKARQRPLRAVAKRGLVGDHGSPTGAGRRRATDEVIGIAMTGGRREKVA